MGSFSAWHWLIVVALIMILFGRGRISALLGDIGKGIGGFRKEVRELTDGQAASRKVSRRAAITPSPSHDSTESAGGNDR
ncbi:twin-arginine translocase TatA/TatE family subunit [Rhizobium leguminosarum bv. viciae]|uniref:Sec-independent protein translocase protein TatA n=2 Tax=Rhizobium ruizarguesonis TaxID=2081791 RepID=A0AAE8Q3I9_9HYPH|nr:twin-arginine translocase TatA/TatE family subunit [Rhizobium ruizarguesonis]TBF00970.1 twin-arginine translocase TatA/TatE family subunit [Rhizobium ruizarguesonis]TCA23034.1 twin-arginine translocase TatA/TatE family subunit [Rhizobium leguminosarum bv. viciae]